MFNLALISVLQLGGGFVQTFKQFLAVRALFGIGMGGIWGLAASTALENLPVEARGLASGVLQQGYAVGYLLAACINLTLVPDTKTGWRSLFWTASGISMFAAFVRAALPESEVFLRAKAHEKARGTDTTKKTKIFLKETKEMLKRHWLLCIYAVLLMTGMFASPFHSMPADASGFGQASTFCHTVLRYVLECGSGNSLISYYRICIPPICKRLRISVLIMPRLRQSSETA